MNLSIIPAALDVFRKGQAVSDPATWRTRGTIVTALSALLMAIPQIGKAFGYDLSILSDPDTDAAIAGVVALVFGLLTHAATSPEFGLLPSAGPAGNAPAGGQGPLGAQSRAAAPDAGAALALRAGPTSDDPARTDMLGGP